MAKKTNAMGSRSNMTGEVVAVKRTDFKNNLGKLDIGIKDNDSTVWAEQFFFNDKIFFCGERVGIDDMLEEIDPDQLDENAVVTAFGDLYEQEYKNKDGKKSKITKTKLIGMYLSEKEPEEFFNGFTARGIVENVFENEENEETNIKIGFPAEEWDKDVQDNVKVIHYVNVILPDEVEHEDIDEGYDITVKGQILNAATQKRDKYGEIIDGEIKRGNYIEVVTKVDDDPDTEKYDDIKSGNYEDDEIDVAEEKPRKVKSKKTAKKPVKKKEEVIPLEEDDDYDDLEEDVDF